MSALTTNAQSCEDALNMQPRLRRQCVMIAVLITVLFLAGGLYATLFLQSFCGCLALAFAGGIAAVSALAIHDQLFRNKGCCESCGYKLSGNESGRCPECGAKRAPQEDAQN